MTVFGLYEERLNPYDSDTVDLCIHMVQYLQNQSNPKRVDKT